MAIKLFSTWCKQSLYHRAFIQLASEDIIYLPYLPSSLEGSESHFADQAVQLPWKTLI